MIVQFDSVSDESNNLVVFFIMLHLLLQGLFGIEVMLTHPQSSLSNYAGCNRSKGMATGDKSKVDDYVDHDQKY